VPRMGTVIKEGIAKLELDSARINTVSSSVDNLL